MNPPRTTVIANVVGEAALIGSLVAITGTVATTAVLALPVAAVGAGAYYGGLIAKRNGYRNAMHVIRDAHKGSGKELERFMEKLNNKRETPLEKDDVINFIVQADFDSTFCKQDEKTDHYELLSFRKMVKYAAKNM
jgi:hypothetical protein